MTKTATIGRERIEELLAGVRTSETVRGLGVRFTIKKRLMRLSNVRTSRGGHLEDATCHYRNAQEISGNTYAIRDLLKAEGFKWDAENKVWHIAPNWRGWGQLAARIVRRLKGDGK